MKIPTSLLMLLAILLVVCCQPVFADDLDTLTDLSDLSDLAENSTETNSASGLEGLSDMSTSDSLDLSQAAEPIDSAASSSNALSLNFGGYLKTLAYWNQESYSDLLWGRYQALSAAGYDAPDEQKLSGYNNMGVRLQLKLEGYLGNKARLFTAFNLNYNLAGSIHGSDASSDDTDIRMVESYVEIYSGSTTWKIGSQIVTWGYMEGVEVPTDRVNARTSRYKSTEYEDGKLASTGILLKQRISSANFDLMFIPVPRQNVLAEFNEYLFTGEDEPIDQETNNGKWAGRLSGTIGNLDAALSYVEGLDVQPDLTDTGTGKAYHPVRSPGIDLQYAFSALLAKLSYAAYYTEDEDGEDPYLKNNWQKYATGVEFIVSGATVNLYAGQILIDNYNDDPAYISSNMLLGQLRERTDFISGHVNANFLTGDALNLVLMLAGYWDEEGKSVQSFAKATFKYKIADSLEVLFSPQYVDYMENIFTDAQFEVKYSF